MRTGRSGWVLGIVSAAFVVTLVLFVSRSDSPGPITRVHAESARIDEADCAACHGDGPKGMTAACTICHAEIGRQVTESAGFHGGLADVARCGRCHGEHHGSDFELAGVGAFALAGVSDRGAYAHEGLSFALGGVHTSGLDCRACHEHADDAVLAESTRRFLGESQRCASCHDDPHAGRLADCRSCHGETEPFARVAAFVHPVSFELAGAHARAACVDCHARGSEFAIEAGGSAAATREPRDCAACHASPHAAPFVTAVAARLAVGAGESCASCHAAEHASFREPRQISAIEHAAGGFELVPPHDRAACTDCHSRLATPEPHVAAFAEYAAAHPGRSPDDCAACHADPHAGQFGGSADRVDCLACHERAQFDPPTFGAAEHARTRFALDGAHAEASCHACHAQHAGAPRMFRGTDTSCASCHSDAHDGAFSREAITANEDQSGSDCSTCHTSTNFADVERFDHARWTSFPLEGAHAAAGCEACHRPRSTPDAHGRGFGVVAELFPGDTTNCATCHADVHGGFFARRSGSLSCATCHTPESFHAAAGKFEHGSSTGFELAGAHDRASCAACHATSPRGVRTTPHPGAGSDDCAVCHADPHAGAFDRVDGGAARCAHCHTTESFAPARDGSFDHGAWTKFALSGRHAEAACASCHAQRTERDQNGRMTERAQGTRCADCHADPHAGQFASGGSTDCAACHSTSPDFLTLDFDHQRDARFALDATHARLACSDCHVPWRAPGGARVVRYKPLGVECADCHDAQGGTAR